MLARGHRRNNPPLGGISEFSYTHCAWAGGTESQFVVERKFIRELHNTSLKYNIRVKILCYKPIGASPHCILIVR